MVVVTNEHGKKNCKKEETTLSVGMGDNARHGSPTSSMGRHIGMGAGGK